MYSSISTRFERESTLSGMEWPTSTLRAQEYKVTCF